MSAATVRVVDHFIREADGTTTRIRWIGGLPVSVDRDYPAVWLDPDAAFLLEELIVPAECVALVPYAGGKV